MNNGTNQTGSAGAKRPLSSRPTLESPAATDWEDSRILSNSDMGTLTRNNPSKKMPLPADNRVKAKSSAFGTGLTLAAVSVLCVGSFFVGQYLSERRHDARLAKEQANLAAAARIAATPLALPPVSAPAEPGDALPVALVGTEQTPAQTVQTINEPLSQAAPKPVPQVQAPAPTTNGKLTTTLENGVKPPPATLEKALQPSVAASPQDSAPATTAQIQQAKARAATSQPKVVAAAPPAKPPVAVDKVPVPSTAAIEKDISLLAALVAHNSANANTTDAAQRMPEESADSLLKRCATLRPERQAACRLNACSGARASAPVCKMTATKYPAPATQR